MHIETMQMKSSAFGLKQRGSQIRIWHPSGLDPNVNQVETWGMKKIMLWRVALQLEALNKMRKKKILEEEKNELINGEEGIESHKLR